LKSAAPKVLHPSTYIFCRRQLITYFLKNKSGPKPEEIPIPAHEQYIVDVLLNCTQRSVASKDRANITPTPGGMQPCAPSQKGVPLVVTVLLSTLDDVSRIWVFMPKNLRQDQPRETIWKRMLEVRRRFAAGVALLDTIQDYGG
jgi:ATP-dependent RNA helicase DOB1